VAGPRPAPPPAAPVGWRSRSRRRRRRWQRSRRRAWRARWPCSDPPADAPRDARALAAAAAQVPSRRPVPFPRSWTQTGCRAIRASALTKQEARHKLLDPQCNRTMQRNNAPMQQNNAPPQPNRRAATCTATTQSRALVTTPAHARLRRAPRTSAATDGGSCARPCRMSRRRPGALTRTRPERRPRRAREEPRRGRDSPGREQAGFLRSLRPRRTLRLPCGEPISDARRACPATHSAVDQPWCCRRGTSAASLLPAPSLP